MKTVSRNLWHWIGMALSGAAALSAGAWLVGPVIRGFLQLNAIQEADSQVAAWLHRAASPALTEFLLWVSWVHGTVGILALTAIVAAATWRYANRLPMAVLTVVVPGGLLLNVAIKHVVQRPRPDWGYAFQALETYSFPSGHTAGASLLYGVVVVLLWPRVRNSGARIGTVIGAGTLVLLVAMSRIVLGVHFLSDCIAAVIEAGVWLAICLVSARATGVFHSRMQASP